MKKILGFGLLVFTSTFITAQEPTQSSSPSIEATSGAKGYTRLPSIEAPSSAEGYTRPNAETRRKRFINSTVGPVAFGRRVANAGVSTWRNSPEEWGSGWEGFGRRVASNLAKNGIKQSMKFGLDEAFKVDSHYYRSKNKSAGARIRNAIISPVTARDRHGKLTIGVPNLVGTYGANIIARETWYPDRYDWKDGVRSGTMSLGFTAAFNLFKEFVWKK